MTPGLRGKLPLGENIKLFPELTGADHGELRGAVSGIRKNLIVGGLRQLARIAAFNIARSLPELATGSSGEL
jgi:hypothetical protein